MTELVEAAETAEQICPACGCQLGESPYEKGEVLYCCQPCATGAECQCGCCEAMEKEDSQQSQPEESGA